MTKLKHILILTVVSLIPLIFTASIPYAIPVELHLNTTKSTEHAWEFDIRLYVISLREGSEYTIKIETDPFWGMDVSLRIAETPYMINGFSVDSGSSTGEIMHFTASKTGNYYIQMKLNSGSGFYDIIVESGITDPATGRTTDFFDISYLLVLILPSLFILAVGLIILIKRPVLRKKRQLISVYKKTEDVKKEVLVEEEELIICPYCGSDIKKNLKICPECNSSLE